MSTSIQTKKQIFLLIQAHRATIMSLGVQKLGLFGSFVREEATMNSDIDLLVEFAHGKKTFKNFMELVFLLEDLYKRPVELVTPESLSPYIKPHIMKEVEYVPLTT